MEKRLLLAVVLMTAAIMITNFLFPSPSPVPPVGPGEDTVVVAAPAPAAALPVPLPTSVTGNAAIDTIPVSSTLYRYGFSTRGAELVRAELLEYPSYRVDGEAVQLVPASVDEFLGHSLVVAGDTVELGSLPFQASRPALDVDQGESTLDFTYADPAGFGITLRYRFDPESYLIGVSGRVSGVQGQQAVLLSRLGPGIQLNEAVEHQSQREFAVVSNVDGAVDREPFRNYEGRTELRTGLTWAGIKDKYFLVALIPEGRPFAGGAVRALPDTTVVIGEEEVELPQVELTTALPIDADGSFEYRLYAGPQDYSRLSAIGTDLEEVTPYGYRWLQPIIRPFAAAVIWVLNTLHDTLGLAYGWVLVVFGVMMRIVLWPLNAKAMRAQMKNMAVQPLLQELRDKYKNDPQKQQEAMLGLYKEHGFNPLAGCLPMLVPFPVLITLFFVFQNTIAFRGAEFLWLPDLSLKDPFYILPLVLVVSMFGLQWVSAHMSGMEQNPQMKMMMYVMPIMMGVIFFVLPAGLNLYYAVTQVASIPQQMLIAKERRKAQEELKKTGGPKLSPPSGGGRRKTRAKR